MNDKTLNQIRESFSNHYSSLLNWLDNIDSNGKRIQLGGTGVDGNIVTSPVGSVHPSFVREFLKFMEPNI